MANVAVLMACHNRRDITLRSIDAITAMATASLDVSVILVDDKSTDGTKEAVRSAHPDVTVLDGSGDLFWGGAMHLAFAHAMERGFDHYLWLNDDTLLAPGALDKLFEAYRSAAEALGPETIVVGAVSEPGSERLSYGGWRARTAGRWPITWASWEKQAPDRERWTECATMNGNCVLIPACVARRLGNLDPHFRHVGGDLDYGLRATRQGCRIVMAADYVGTCEGNVGLSPWDDPRRTVLGRWRQLLGPKGFPPASWQLFTYRHKGLFWFFPWLAPYVRFWLKLVAPRIGKKKSAESK